jgi:flavin-dependent dehydrogenase
MESRDVGEQPARPRAAYDAIVVGGGPAGTTFAHLLQRRGHDVLLVERERHPRFCIGESLLPGSMPVWRELGLVERFEKAGFLRKYGAYFCFAAGHAPEYFHFPDATRMWGEHAYEVPRAEFDRVLWEAAREAGVEVRDRTEALQIDFEGQRATGARLRLPGGDELRVGARLVADCSGRATLLGHQLGMRRRDPRLRKVALFRHYDDVLRSTGDDAGTIAIVATRFGWMWLIPFAGGAASVGAVAHQPWFAERRRRGLDLDAIWAGILAEVPAVARRLVGARPTRPVEAEADFQYRVRRLAGDGWVAIGDAGAFLDPVFSSGVHLAMSGAHAAARAAADALAGGRLPRARDFAGYARRSRGALGVYSWYDPAFRTVFLRPRHGLPGVERLKREIISVLAGAVLPPWRARLPMHLLLAIARLQRRALSDGEPA